MKYNENKRITMWYKIHHLLSKRFKKSQIARLPGVYRSSVIRYCKMSELELLSRPSSGGNRPEKQGKYESYVKETLREHPGLSAAQVGDWIKEYGRQCLRYPTRQSIILSAKSGRNTIYLRLLHPSTSTRSYLTPHMDRKPRLILEKRG